MSNFDLEFTQIQIDMVAICLEYSRQNCDKIYIHVIHENSTTFVNYFFQANGEMVTKNQISSDDNLINTKRQQDTLSIILNDARKLFKLCNKYNQTIPTEMKIIYDVKNQKLDSEYNYSQITTDTKCDHDISIEWFESLKQ